MDVGENSCRTPPTKASRTWTHIDPAMAPTIVHKYDNCSTNWGPSETLYMQYIDDIDHLLPNQVSWTPYARDELTFALNENCMIDQDFWRRRWTLICFYVVEYHLPHRVAKQFARYQECPPEYFSTSHKLHDLDRSKNKTITDWDHEHRAYIDEWNDGRGRLINLARHDARAFDKYLAWLHGATRVHLRKTWTNRDILDDSSASFDDADEHDYEIRTRKRVTTGPTRDRVTGELLRGIREAETSLRVTPGSEGTESTLQKMVHRSRRLINRLACWDPEEDLDDIQPSPEKSTSRSDWDDTDGEDRFEDHTLLSQTRGAPEPTQTSPESSQRPRIKRNNREPLDTSRPLPHNGSRVRKPKVKETPEQKELGKRKGRK